MLVTVNLLFSREEFIDVTVVCLTDVLIPSFFSY